MGGTSKLATSGASLAAILLSTLACGSAADGAPVQGQAAGATPAAKGDKTPEARGRSLLKVQLDALGNEDAFVATFAADASVLTPLGSFQSHDANGGLAASIGFLNPHATIKTATFDHFSSGGNTQVSWFAAEIHLAIASHEPGQRAATETHTLRVVELVDHAANDKVAVAAFTLVGPLATYGTSPINAPTKPGPLADLLVSPAQLAIAVGDGAVVFGTDANERGEGSAEAKKLLGRWGRLAFTLDPKSAVREVHTASFGYAITNVRLVTSKSGEGNKLSAFVLALPDASTPGGWSVIAASYGALF